jgi:hypothetical protein
VHLNSEALNLCRPCTVRVFAKVGAVLYSSKRDHNVMVGLADAIQSAMSWAIGPSRLGAAHLLLAGRPSLGPIGLYYSQNPGHT